MNILLFRNASKAGENNYLNSFCTTIPSLSSRVLFTLYLLALMIIDYSQPRLQYSVAKAAVSTLQKRSTYPISRVIKASSIKISRRSQEKKQYLEGSRTIKKSPKQTKLII